MARDDERQKAHRPNEAWTPKLGDKVFFRADVPQRCEGRIVAVGGGADGRTVQVEWKRAPERPVFFQFNRDTDLEPVGHRPDEARPSRIRIIAEAAHRFLESRPLVVEAHRVPVRSGREMQLEDLCCWFESVCTELEQAGGPRREPAAPLEAIATDTPTFDHVDVARLGAQIEALQAHRRESPVPRYDQKDAVIVALVRRLHGICRPAPATTVFTPAEIARAGQQHLEITWCDNNLMVRVIGDT